MTATRESIWREVQPHRWKYETRRSPIDAIVFHATRGGQGYDGNTELNASLNWFRSSDNLPHRDWAGISNYAIGPGRIVEVVPDSFIPRFASSPSDNHALSVEVAQSDLGQPIEPETIAACVEFTVEALRTYPLILPVRLERVENDHAFAGITDHKALRQGRASGKSDNDVQFWGPFWPALMEALKEDDEVTTTQYEDLILSVFSGSEDRISMRQGEDMDAYLARDRAKRLENATYRMTAAANARDRSVRDYAVSSVSLWQRIIRLVPGLSREA